MSPGDGPLLASTLMETRMTGRAERRLSTQTPKRAGGGMTLLKGHLASSAAKHRAVHERRWMMGIFSSSNPKQGRSKPDFSNVTSGNSSSAGSPVGDTPASDAYDAYTVREGDTLSKIARAHYGDASKWPRIYAANRDIIKDPDLIYPGQTLTIPTP